VWIGSEVGSEVAAALDSLVVLFGEHRADEAGGLLQLSDCGDAEHFVEAGGL
jgi:hypothetical protein